MHSRAVAGFIVRHPARMYVMGPTPSLGSDTLIGGAGADTYVIDNAGDFVVERAGEGTDTVRSSRTYTLGDNVENLVLTGTATDGTGNELANILTGNAAANVLIGNGGNDTLIGGAGSDTLTGGAGIDTASYASAAVGVTVNLSVTAVQNTVGAGNDKINSVENVLGSAHNDTLTGNSAANTVEGGAGNDVLRGGSGNDTLLGDTGNDTLTGGLGADHMTGGAGDDVYDVEDAGDTVTEGSSSGGHDKVTSTVSFVLGSYLEDLTLMGSDPVNATGNSLANVLTGNSAANVLDGKGGADTMIGGTGNDFYYVDNASDVVKEGNATGGLDQVSSTVSFTLGSNIEQLTLTGSGAINGVGNNLANTMIGNGAVNSLKGAGGADTLDGRGGDDLVQGGAGRDMLTGGTGNDKFVFLDGDTSATRSLADHILDFAAGDKVDLHNIDANTTLATNQAFHFVGTAGFTVGDPGELHYSTGSGTTWIEGDTDGDGTADFAIYMAGDHTLAASDFVL